MPPPKFLTAAAALLCISGASLAQIAPPDAGKVLSGNTAAGPKAPGSPATPQLKPPVEPSSDQDSGPKVIVVALALSGNTLFGTNELTALVQDQLGKPQSLGGMRAIARRLGDHYRANGYPFARAIIPAQDFKDGTLAIVLLEGRYGSVKATGASAIAEGAQRFLSDLKSGDVIEGGRLARAMLILDDVPGLEVVPTVSPGSRSGTGDLTVRSTLAEAFGAVLGVDNHGSRYTGEYRARLDAFHNTAFTFGDRLAVGALVSDASMWLGSVDYDMPLDGRGLRGSIGYAQTNYELGKDFASLGASGLAKIWSCKVSYPFVRSQAFNLHGSAGFQHKTLRDDYVSTATVERKFSQNFPLSLRFDLRDGLLGGGVTFGQFTWTLGNLHLDDTLLAADATTTRKAGHFSKVNLDLARIQRLGGKFSVYIRASAQWTRDNLDSSERLGLGGAESVRAYPLGEGTGDEGWLGQAELRYELSALTPFLFVDAGSTKLNHAPWNAAADKTRSISGAGIGVRAIYEKWSGEIVVASRLSGGAPQSDSRDHSVVVLFSASRSF